MCLLQRKPGARGAEEPAEVLKPLPVTKGAVRGSIMGVGGPIFFSFQKHNAKDGPEGRGRAREAQRRRGMVALSYTYGPRLVTIH